MGPSAARSIPPHTHPRHDPVLPAGIGLVRRLERGRTVIQQGSLSPRMVVVRSGILREGAHAPDGRWTVLDLLGPGDVAGRLTHGRAATSVRATGPAEVVTIDPVDAGDVLRHHHAAASSLLRAMQVRLDRARRLALLLAWNDVASRILVQLTDLASRHGRAVPGGVRVDLRITQDELGAMVGAARETVNRTLVRLVTQHAIRLEARRYIVTERGLTIARERCDTISG